MEQVYVDDVCGYVSAKYIQEFKEEENKETNDTSSYTSQEIKITCLSSLPSTYNEYEKGILNKLNSSFQIDNVWYNYSKDEYSNVVGGYYNIQIHIL